MTRSRLTTFLLLAGLGSPLRSGELELVSFAPANPHDLGAQATLVRAMTDDGRFVLLETASPNLLPGEPDRNGCVDLVLHDRVTGTKRWVSHAPGTPGVPRAGGGLIPFDSQRVLSNNGRVVIYLTGADDFCRGFSTARRAVLVDFDTGAVDALADVLPPVPGDPVPADAISATSLSADGKRVLLGVGNRVVLFDRDAHTATLVSHAAGAPMTPANDFSKPFALSADGRFVLYSSAATDLVPKFDDGNGPFMNVYLYDAATGVTRLVSQAASTTTSGGNGHSTPRFLSADGRTVLFSSTASNLVEGQVDPVLTEDLFAFEVVTGVSRLVSHAPGQPTTSLDFGSVFQHATADGRFVLFVSLGMAAPGTDVNGAYDTFLYDLLAGASTLVSRRAGEPAITADQGGLGQAVTADGQSVVFASRSQDLLVGGTAVAEGTYRFDRATGQVSTLLPGITALRTRLAAEADVLAFDTANTPELTPPVNDAWARVEDSFALELDTGIVEPLSLAAFPVRTTAPLNSYDVSMSSDGKTVVYSSASADMVATAEPQEPGHFAIAYDRLTGRNEFVAHVVGEPTIPVPGKPVAVSENGRYVLVASTELLMADMTDPGRGVMMAFLYDRQTDSAKLVSHLADQPLAASYGEPLALSEDGRFVVWASSAGGFVPGVPGGFTQLYLWDRDLASHVLVSRGLGSPTEPGNAHSPFELRPEISVDGRLVLFASTASNLVAGDSPSTLDLFLFDAAFAVVRHVSHLPGQPGQFFRSVSPEKAVLSELGQFVAFTAQTDIASGHSVYRWDAFTGDTEPIATGGRFDEFIVRDLSITGDLLFDSTARTLVPGVTDTNTWRDTFVHDRALNTLRLVSHRFGAPAITGSQGVVESLGFAGPSRVLYVAYAAELLSPATVTAVPELLLYDLATSTTQLVTHAPGQPDIGVGRGEGPLSIAASRDGSSLAFASSARRLSSFDFDFSDIDGVSPGDSGFDVFLFHPDQLFSDGFESGNLAAWSAVEP